VVASGEQMSSAVEDEVVILQLHEGAYYGLDPVGARVWGLIQEPRTVGEICDTLVREYEVGRERCEADVLALLGELRERDLVEVRP
jgi:hypothetical protein